MLSMDFLKCTGCSACAQICPHHCISMKANKEGFLYPSIDTTHCVDCKLCEKVCPCLKENQEPAQPIETYAAFANSDAIRMQSSSGGVFSLLANDVLDKNGVVFGAVFADGYTTVIHAMAQTKDDLSPMQGSKYLQSDLNGTYKEAKECLTAGRQVLFVGTPCQIDGLRGFLQKEYMNLLCVSVICHGVPSPLLWQKYLSQLTKRDRNVVEHVAFRNKDVGWENYNVVVDTKEKHINDCFADNPYMKMFLQNLCLRSSCYQCPSKPDDGADLTIGDFWGIDNVAPEMNDKKGTSLVIVKTQKGMAAIEALKNTCVLLPVKYDDAIKGNYAYDHSVACPDARKHFYYDVCKHSFNTVERKYLKHKSFSIKRYLAQTKMWKCLRYLIKR